MASSQNDFDPLWLIKVGQGVIVTLYGLLVLAVSTIRKNDISRVEKLEDWKEAHDKEANGRIEVIRQEIQNTRHAMRNELQQSVLESNHTFDKLFDELKEDRKSTGESMLRIERKIAVLMERSGKRVEESGT